MQFIEFQKTLSPYPVFSLLDIRKVYPDFSYRQLDRWGKKGYVKKIKQGYYCFAEGSFNDSFLKVAANKIYGPSYISLETALKYYGLIPEEIFQTTSITTKKTARFETIMGSFSYRHMKPNLFFGYDLQGQGSQKILIAEPEKAILDYLYLSPRIRTADDFREMRINTDELQNNLNEKKFHFYLEAFHALSLSRRAQTFLTTCYYDKSYHNSR